jgi:molybdopterin-biosynthesis enzyme MoeA-like protein
LFGLTLISECAGGAVDDYMHRRELQEAEAKAKLDAAKAEQERADIEADKRTRTWRVQHWGMVAKSARAEAHQNKQMQLQKLEQEYEDKLEMIQEEWESREMAKLRLQVEG